MSPPTHPGLRSLDDITRPGVVYHYTDKAGLDAILRTQILKASTRTGNQHTHYGQGVYLTDIGPLGLTGYGHGEAIQRIYNEISVNAVEKMQYFLKIAVDPSWGHLLHLAASSPDKTSHARWLNIFIVPGSADLAIAGHVLEHGETPIKAACDGLPTANGKTPAQNHAYQLNQWLKALRDDEKKQSARYGDQPLPGSDYVFIGGHTVKRPAGWDGDWRFPTGD